MGISDIISRLFKSDGDKSKSGAADRTNPDNQIDVPKTEDISYLKTEKIGSAQRKTVREPDEPKEVNQKKSADGTISNVMTKITDAKILDVLSNVYDPEIPIDIVNLGLVYDIDIDGEIVNVKMTMTAPGCPASAQITSEAKYLIEELEGVKEAIIEIVWDPPWDPSRMSDDAKQSMGYL